MLEDTEQATLCVGSNLIPGKWHVYFWSPVERRMILTAYDLTKITKISDLCIPDCYKHLNLEPRKVSHVS